MNQVPSAELYVILFSVLKRHIKISHDINLVEYDSVGKEYETIDIEKLVKI